MSEDTPAKYEERAIIADAQRAAKLGESPMKACSWNWKWYPENMRIWMAAYNRQLAEQDLLKTIEADALSRAGKGTRHG